MKNLAVTILFLVMLVISMVSGASLHRYNNNGGHASYHSSSNVTTTTTTKHHKHKKGHHTKVLFHSRNNKNRLTTKTKSTSSSLSFSIYTSTLTLAVKPIVPSPLSSSTTVKSSSKTTVKPSATTKKQTSSHVPTPTSSPIGGGGSSNSTTGGSGTTYTGDGTWFNTGLGSCGWTNSDTEYIAALDAPLMNNPANPNKNPLCGRMIEVTNQANNKSVKVKIVSSLLFFLHTLYASLFLTSTFKNN